MTAQVTADHLTATLQSARQRTLELIDDLTDEQFVGPKLPIVNPMIWEIGHVAWFYEFFILREEYGHQPLLDRGDKLYVSVPNTLGLSLRCLRRAVCLTGSEGRCQLQDGQG